jgi:hypothetical protein
MPKLSLGWITEVPKQTIPGLLKGFGLDSADFQISPFESSFDIGLKRNTLLAHLKILWIKGA